MAKEKVTCPNCNSSEHVYKVSHLYLASLAEQEKKETAALMDEDLEGIEIPRGFGARQFIQKFAPPSGETRSMRAVSPDLIVVGFGLLAIYMLYQMYFQQPGFFPYAVGILVLFYAAYFIFRKKIVGRYKDDVNSVKSKDSEVEKSVGRWMKLYYCADDDMVFYKHSKKGYFADEMDALLRTDE